MFTICWRLSAFKSPSHEKSIFLKIRSFFSFKFLQGHNWLTNYPDSEFHGHWKTLTLSSSYLLAFWLSLCFGSCLLFLVCHYTAFLFSTRAMTTRGWLPNAHRDQLNWLLSYLQLKLWVRIPLQIGDSPSAVSLYSCVSFHKCVSVTSYLCSEFCGHDWPQTCRYKTRELWGLFAEVRENLSQGFEIIDIFCKNAVLNIYRYLKRFHTYKKMNNIFLKVRPFFITDAKNYGNRLNHSCRKTRFKNVTNAHINSFGPTPDE